MNTQTTPEIVIDNRFYPGAKVTEVRAISPQFDITRQFDRTEKGDKDCEKFLRGIKKLDNDRKKPTVAENKVKQRVFKVNTEYNKRVKRSNGSPSKLRVIAPLNLYPLTKLIVRIQTVTV